MNSEGPLDRVKQFGLRAVSALDLLAVAVCKDAETAEELEPAIRTFLRQRGVSRAADMSRADLEELSGLTGHDATRLLCAVELGRRAGLAGKGEIECIERSSDVAQLFDYLREERKEHFCAVFLDSKNGILAVKTIHIGTVDMSVVGAREVFREAVREGAASLIVVHNHPSGNPEPSHEDIDITHRLAEAGDLLGIRLLDHVILGHHRHVSLADRGVVDP